jgi:hypothetical protein
MDSLVLETVSRWTVWQYTNSVQMDSLAVHKVSRWTVWQYTNSVQMDSLAVYKQCPDGQSGSIQSPEGLSVSK